MGIIHGANIDLLTSLLFIILMVKHIEPYDIMVPYVDTSVCIPAFKWDCMCIVHKYMCIVSVMLSVFLSLTAALGMTDSGLDPLKGVWLCIALRTSVEHYFFWVETTSLAYSYFYFKLFLEVYAKTHKIVCVCIHTHKFNTSDNQHIG